ncbi:neurofilament light polypeptide-like [Helianthus annuus]|uniref:neurofilament light polypeptide-like n=1 Tax=Helianthus annuus TaxID=4232 RepID=UPI000B8F4083|nr:neurofilament light polypeptide-like [Helianthus annuus]
MSKFVDENTKEVAAEREKGENEDEVEKEVEGEKEVEVEGEGEGEGEMAGEKNTIEVQIVVDENVKEVEGEKEVQGEGEGEGDMDGDQNSKLSTATPTPISDDAHHEDERDTEGGDENTILSDEYINENNIES